MLTSLPDSVCHFGRNNGTFSPKSLWFCCFGSTTGFFSPE